MRIRVFAVLAAVMLSSFVSAARADDPAPVQRDEMKVRHRLLNVTAADAADAVQRFLAGKQLKATVVAEPVSNTVRVVAAAEMQEQVAKILEAMDVAPP